MLDTLPLTHPRTITIRGISSTNHIQYTLRTTSSITRKSQEFFVYSFTHRPSLHPNFYSCNEGVFRCFYLILYPNFYPCNEDTFVPSVDCLVRPRDTQAFQVSRS